MLITGVGSDVLTWSLAVRKKSAWSSWSLRFKVLSTKLLWTCSKQSPKRRSLFLPRTSLAHLAVLVLVLNRRWEPQKVTCSCWTEVCSSSTSQPLISGIFIRSLPALSICILLKLTTHTFRFEEVDNVEFSRIGTDGANTNRTFDLVVTLKNGSSFSFTSIQRYQFMIEVSRYLTSLIETNTPPSSTTYQLRTWKFLLTAQR